MHFFDFFKKKIKQEPENIAVVYGNESLTYRDLDLRSSYLANILNFKGIRKGDVVALGLYNSPDLIIGFLAILKSGGIYLPIDPNYPSKRIIEMLIDSQAKFLILEENTKSVFSDFKGVFCFLNEKHELTPSLCDLPNICLDQIAYIIYTSGSTGHPKGIVVSYAALNHAAIAFAKIQSNRPISLLSGSISFDPSILIIIHSLILGGTICMFNNTASGIDIDDFQKIIDIIIKNNVNFILSTPSFYANLLEKNNIFYCIRDVYLCGESIPPSLIDKHIHMVPNANLYNTYAPSEYAIGATVAVVYDALKKQRYKVSIGRCFSDNKIYIVDTDLNCVTPGVKGEIIVAGPGLAKGYLNRDDLTNSSFLYWNDPEGCITRVYRTGDIGYFLSSNDIMFVGRHDFQVKVNGHRVELEEIEKMILEFPGIDRSLVILKDNTLIAFFSVTSIEINAKNLEQSLIEILPSYMVPQNFICITQWPVTKNGKIDRKKLVEFYLE